VPINLGASHHAPGGSESDQRAAKAQGHSQARRRRRSQLKLEIVDDAEVTGTGSILAKESNKESNPGTATAAIRDSVKDSVDGMDDVEGGGQLVNSASAHSVSRRNSTGTIG